MPPLSAPDSFSLPALLHAARRRLLGLFQRWDARFPLRNANLSEGLRAACSASAMLLLGECLNNPLFSWAAIGAFLTCLADSAGSNRARLASMGGFALVSTLGGMVAATAASMGMGPGLFAIMACAGVAGFSRIYGAATGLVMMLAAGVSAIMADSPVMLWPVAHSHVLIYFAGCAWATFLGLTVWRIHPFGPARLAVARVYGALAELAAIAADQEEQADAMQLLHAADLAAHTRRHVRADIAAAKRAVSAVAGERTESRRLYENLLVRLARAEALLGCITVLADLRLTHYQPLAAQRRFARVLDAMARLLREMQRSMGKAEAITPAEDARITMRLRQLVARLPSGAARLLQLADVPVSADDMASPAELKQATREGGALDGLRWVKHRLVSWWRKAESHASAGSAELHHGWRCAAAAGATYLIVHLLELPFGYWATMATMLVMQPSIADSWSRSMERAIGSVVGGLLAVGVCLLIHSPLALALLVFPLTVLTMGLRPVSYGLYATFLTPVFVLVADVAVDPHQQLSNAILRAGNNVIGTTVAVVASYLFWPRRQTTDLRGQLMRMVAGNLAYLRDAVQTVHYAHHARLMHDRRRDACVANVETGLMLQRLMREQGLGSAVAADARTCVALSRRLAAAATHLWLHPSESCSELDDWLAQMAVVLAQQQPGDTLAELLRQRPAPLSLAAADAVDTLCLLALALHPKRIEPV